MWRKAEQGVCCIVPETAGQAKGGLMFLSDQWWAEGERSHLEEIAEDVQARKQSSCLVRNKLISVQSCPVGPALAPTALE